MCLLSGVSVVYSTLRDGRNGWDYDAYCRSIMAIQTGNDPYLAKNSRRFLGNNSVLPYPAGALVLLSPACLKPRTLYPVFYTLLLVMSTLGVWRLWPEQPLLLAALWVGGLMAAPCNYLTGNIGILELGAFVAALAASQAGRQRSAGMWLGVVAAIKVTPLAFAAVFAAVVWRERGPRASVQLGLGVVLGVAIVHGLTVLIDPSYEASMFRALSGGHPGQFGALDEMQANWTNQALPLILEDGVALLGGPAVLAHVLNGALLLAGVVLLIRLWRREPDALTLWSYAVLIVCLLLPRFKPYSFVYALVPLFYLLRRKSPGQQALVMLLGTLLPLLVFRFRLGQPVEGDLLKFLVGVNQMLALCALFALLLWWDRNRWAPGAPAASRPSLAPADPGT